jgi:hypothetical protein
MVGTNNGVPPVCVIHRSRVGRATQGDQKAQGQNRTHRFFSNRPAAPAYVGLGPRRPISGGFTISHIGGITGRCAIPHEMKALQRTVPDEALGIVMRGADKEDRASA